MRSLLDSETKMGREREEGRGGIQNGLHWTKFKDVRGCRDVTDVIIYVAKLYQADRRRVAYGQWWQGCTPDLLCISESTMKEEESVALLPSR
jgi:hypothetical protein